MQNEKFDYRTFKFERKLHDELVERKFLLGEVIEWQVNTAVREWLQKGSQELRNRKKQFKKEKEKEKEEAKEKDENPKQEPENKPEVTL